MKMKKWIVSLMALTLAAGMLSGCERVEKAYSTQAGSIAETYANYEAASGVMYAADTASAPSNGNRQSMDSSIPLPANRKWIITMRLSAETEDLDTALGALSEHISAMNGYVESQNITNSASYRRTRSADLTIRIPAEQVDAFVAEVDGIANIISNSRNVEDITLAYSDTEGRVNALKTEEQRLLELMARAENMSDLLEIEARLTEVRYQLESYASTLRLYDNQIDYATVNLYISEVEKFTPVEAPTFWERITEGLADSVVSLGETIVDLIAWIIVDLPYLIVWGLVIWGGFAIGKRAVRKHRAKKAAKKQAEKPKE